MKPPAATAARPLHISLLALPDAVISTLSGLFDTLNAFALTRGPPGRARHAPFFHAEIAGEAAGPLMLASGIPIGVQRTVGGIAATDIVVVPSVLLPPGGWTKGRYPRLLDWIARMHAQGALLCSACSGLFLLAETGLFDGHSATVHYDYARAFASAYPSVAIHPERALVISGTRDDFVCSGASTSWHDLVLYLIARFAGATAAQDTARMFALQWHQEGLAPYIVFEGRSGHGDAEVEGAQQWLSRHFSVARPVEELVRRSKLASRTFKRRFTIATGLAPIAYVQRLRVEDAKRRLERTDAPIDEISWRVGYEDAAFFRRLFKRVTGLAPGDYRKRFRLPEYSRR